MLAVTIQVKTVTLNSAVFSKAYIMAAGRPEVNCNYMYNSGRSRGGGGGGGGRRGVIGCL